MHIFANFTLKKRKTVRDETCAPKLNSFIQHDNKHHNINIALGANNKSIINVTVLFAPCFTNISYVIEEPKNKVT